MNGLVPGNKVHIWSSYVLKLALISRLASCVVTPHQMTAIL